MTCDRSSQHRRDRVSNLTCDLQLLAALRGSIKVVLIPKDNEKDLAEIPDNVKQGIEIIPVETVDDVLKHALTEDFHPIGMEGEAAVKTSRSGHSEEDHSGVVTH